MSASVQHAIVVKSEDAGVKALAESPVVAALSSRVFVTPISTQTNCDVDFEAASPSSQEAAVILVSHDPDLPELHHVDSPLPSLLRRHDCHALIDADVSIPQLLGDAIRFITSDMAPAERSSFAGILNETPDKSCAAHRQAVVSSTRLLVRMIRSRYCLQPANALSAAVPVPFGGGVGRCDCSLPAAQCFRLWNVVKPLLQLEHGAVCMPPFASAAVHSDKSNELVRLHDNPDIDSDVDVSHLCWPTTHTTPPSVGTALSAYMRKWLGHQGRTSLPSRPCATELCFTFIGVLVSHALLASIGRCIGGNDHDVNRMLLGSFGALSVLLFTAPHSPFAQPLVVVGAHLTCTFVGTAIRMLLVDVVAEWILLSVGMALAVTLMHGVGLSHPPAGGAAFISLVAAPGSKWQALGWMFVIFPVLLGCVVFISVALIVNNASARRRYPHFWIGGWASASYWKQS